MTSHGQDTLAGQRAALKSLREIAEIIESINIAVIYFFFVHSMVPVSSVGGSTTLFVTRDYFFDASRKLVFVIQVVMQSPDFITIHIPWPTFKPLSPFETRKKTKRKEKSRKW